jgi:hypothetical protein
VLCAGSTLQLAQTSRHQRIFLAPLPKSASNNLRKWFLSPTGRLNLGIITKGRFTVVLIIPSSWGFPTGPVRHQDIFWRRCRGERGFLCNDPRFYQILGEIFAFVLLEMFGNSQGFKTLESI